MWASVISFGNHGMSRLHVCVDRTLSPFGSNIWMGVVANFLFTIGAPSTMKWPVAPESDMAYSTALVRRLVSKIMCACGDVRKLRLRMIAFHAACRVGIANGVVQRICAASFVGIDNSFGISFGIFRDGLKRSLDRLDMVTVASSSSSLYSISV